MSDDGMTEQDLRDTIDDLNEDIAVLRAHHSDAEKAFDRCAVLESENADLRRRLEAIRDKVVAYNRYTVWHGCVLTNGNIHALELCEAAVEQTRFEAQEERPKNP